MLERVGKTLVEDVKFFFCGRRFGTSDWQLASK
jgi:hypothetical protein